MVSHCAVIGCTNSAKKKNIGFYRFPSVYQGCSVRGRCPEAINALAKQRRQKWVEALRRENLTEKILTHDRVCGKHFITGKPAKLTEKDHPDWVPSLHMGRAVEHKEGLRSSKPGQTKRRVKIPLSRVRHLTGF